MHGGFDCQTRRMHADWRGCRAYANYHVSPLDYLSAISACIGRVHGIQIAAIVRRRPFSTRSESVEKRIRRIARAISNFIQRKFPLFNNLRKGNFSFDNLLLLLHFVDVRFRFDIDLNKSASHSCHKDRDCFKRGKWRLNMDKRKATRNISLFRHIVKIYM